MTCCLGALLRAIGRRVLHLALFQYVDDYYGPEHIEAVEHAMNSFARRVAIAVACALSLGRRGYARLVRACLGEEAVQKRKLHHGAELEVLGVDVRFSAEGVHMMPSRDKRYKWCCRIRDILADGTLHSGDASKLAGECRSHALRELALPQPVSGALNWASQRAFKRLGRAMLVPLRNQIWSARLAHLMLACLRAYLQQGEE